VNPFTSPIGTPERMDFFSNQHYPEPVFGGDNAPSFGHSVNDDSAGNIDVSNTNLFSPYINSHK